MAVERRQLLAQPGQIQVLIEPSDEMVAGNLVIQVEAVEQPVLHARHPDDPSCLCTFARSDAHTIGAQAEIAIGFFNRIDWVLTFGFAICLL